MSLLLLPIITIIVFHRVKNVIKTAGFARGGCNQVRIFPELQTRAKKKNCLLKFRSLRALYLCFVERAWHTESNHFHPDILCFIPIYALIRLQATLSALQTFNI